MKEKLKNGIALSLLPQVLFVGWLGSRPDVVEKYYSNQLYPVISQFFRTLYGWIPFSLGEVIYTLLALLGLQYISKKRKRIMLHPWLFLRNVVLVFSVFYFTFNLVWAVNYYRKPISEQFAIRDSVTPAEVFKLTEQLILKTNQLQTEIAGDSIQMVKVPYTRNQIFEKTIEAYKIVQKQLPFLTYRHASVKKASSGALASYMGIGGYLNPFTNEAQVNGLTPLFRLPVVTAHEIGHQVGYAKENETNFIGYLVTMKNENVYFQYSAAAYALSHCLSAIRRADEEKYNAYVKRINPGVLQNYKELYDFNLKYANPLEPVFKSLFSTFLKANQQKDGIKSYSKIVELLVAYHEKYPL